jgi:hypothetical protein
MQTFSLNSLSESFECDRGTMVKALRDVPPDFEKSKTRPEWKISTASRSLEAHRRTASRVLPGPTEHVTANVEIDPRLQRHYVMFDRADASMRQLKTVEERRKAAIGMGSQIAQMDALQRQISLENGNDEELTEHRGDRLFFLYLGGFEGPCDWSTAEAWAACDVRE